MPCTTDLCSPQNYVGLQWAMTLRWLHRALSENRMCHISHKERSRSPGLEATTVCFQRDAPTHYFACAPNTALVHIYTWSAHGAMYTLVTWAARTRTPALGRKGHLTEISGVQKRGEGRGRRIPVEFYMGRSMFQKAKIFSLGIHAYLYTRLYSVHTMWTSDIFQAVFHLQSAF